MSDRGRAGPQAGPDVGDRPSDMQEADPRTHRPIRSFVLRQGRMTDAQRRALEALWPRYGLDVAGPGSQCAAARDLDALFGRHAEHVLEIGFGNGEALLHAALHEPQRDFIGVEVHQPGVGRLLNALAAQELGNVRAYCHDAVEVLQQEIAPAALDEVRVFFPDPWHKKRHNKRRLIQPAFVELLASRLKAGGLLHLATDWQDYAEHMFDVLDASPSFRNVAGARAAVPRPAWRRQTHFESRGQRLGHGVWDMLYRRV